MWRSDNFKRHLDTNHKGGIVGAAGRGDEAIVEWCLSIYSSVVNGRDGGFDTPLFVAAGNGHEGIVRLLLDGGADIPTDYSDCAMGRNNIFALQCGADAAQPRCGYRNACYRIGFRLATDSASLCC